MSAKRGGYQRVSRLECEMIARNLRSIQAKNVAYANTAKNADKH